MLQSNAFSNLITKPTRVLKTSQTIIDHIFSDDSESIITPKVLLYKISDHFLIICTIENTVRSKSNCAPANKADNERCTVTF